jgi:hypothetical protein
MLRSLRDRRFGCARQVARCAAAALALGGTAGADEICVPGAREPVGVVVRQTGTVWAEADECGRVERRPLACGESVRSGDRVLTDAGSVVAFEAQGSFAQLAPESALDVGLASDGGLDLRLARGSVRVVDPETATGPDRRLSTSELASVGRGDTEAFADASGTRICEWGQELQVGPAGRAAGQTLAVGSCIGGGLATSASQGVVVSVAEGAYCELAVGGLSPIDVAGGPGGPVFPGIDPLPPVMPSCQAGACTNNGESGIPVVESPPGYEPPPD